MSMGSAGVVVWIVLLAAVVYYLYTPLPPGTKEPWKQQIPVAAVRLIADVSAVGSALGFGSELNITRRLVQFNDYLAYDSTGGAVQTYDDDFDGVAVRVYTPKGVKNNSPGVVYIHGGGWALLNVDAYDVFCREVAYRANIIIASVEYRLAPEHKFPIPLEDSLKATKFFLRNAAKYGVDPSRIGVAGDSAGGNLAMAVSLKLSAEQDKTLPRLKLTSLIYPALQAFDFMLPSYQIYKDKYSASLSTRETLIKYYQFYAFGKLLSQQYGFESNGHIPKQVKSNYQSRISRDVLPKEFLDQVHTSQTPESTGAAKSMSKDDLSILLDPYFSPLLASDDELRRLPKTYIMTAELDALRDDGWILADRMRRINHPFYHKHYDGLEHGFCLFLFYDSAFEFIRDFKTFLNENL